MKGVHRLTFILLLVLLPISRAEAHPGVGIVIDRQGNVFYTDRFRVWRITPDGRKSVVGPDVHELSIDNAGNVLGEDSKYMGATSTDSVSGAEAPTGASPASCRGPTDSGANLASCTMPRARCTGCAAPSAGAPSAGFPPIHATTCMWLRGVTGQYRR